MSMAIETPVLDIAKISHVKSGTLWVTDEDGELIQVDTDGNVIERRYLPGPNCVTKDGALLYQSDPFSDDEDEDEDKPGIRIKKRTSLRTVTLLKTEESGEVLGIHSSLINGHILVFMRNINLTELVYVSHKITRYDNDGMKIKDIWKNDRIERQLFFPYACITENTNEDIILSFDGKAVVGLNRSGGHRFMYSHPEGLNTKDICTDKYGHILVAFITSIHLLDEDGTFKKILLRNMPGVYFNCLCLDERQKLYVGNDHGNVKVYKYLKDD